MDPLQVNRRREKNNHKLFMKAWRGLANIEMEVEVKTESHAPEQSQALTEFHLFPKLPLQLRQMIWGFTVLPRVIQLRNCRQPGRNGYDEFEPSIPRPLCPLNIVPYHSMPATFWTCFESRNEVARYYQNIAFVSEGVNLYPWYLPASFFEKSEPSSISDHYCIEQATFSFKTLLTESPSRPLEPSVPFNPDEDIFDFDELLYTTADSMFHQPERNFLLFNTPFPSEVLPWRRITYNEEVGALIIRPWAVKRARITPQSAFWSWLVNNFRKDDISSMEPIIFKNFTFQDLDEFIIQDVDCLLYHKSSWQAYQDGWRKYLLKMFKVERCHNEFAAVRGGSTFKIPRVVILPGAISATVCNNCLESQSVYRHNWQWLKSKKYNDKKLRILAGGKF
ncbi:hypothetical protein ACHAPC_003424 [Botrytis cinerea]